MQVPAPIAIRRWRNHDPAHHTADDHLLQCLCRMIRRERRGEGFMQIVPAVFLQDFSDVQIAVRGEN